MQTPDHSELAFTLTKHYFGETVALMVKALFNYDQAPFRVLRYDLSHVGVNDLKKSLLILVKYQLVDYSKSVKNFNQQYEYSVVPQRIFAFFRTSRFIYAIGSREGPMTNLILSTILERSLVSVDKLIHIITTKLTQKGNFDEAKRIELNDMIELLSAKCYLVKTNNVCLNIERLNRIYRDDLIIDTVHNYYNGEDRIRSLCKVILDKSFHNTSDDAAISAPVPLTEILSVLVPEIFKDKSQLDRYLARLTSETNNRFFLSCGMNPDKGLMYALDIGSVVNYLVKEHLSSLITTRFGPKCCRVFRVLLMKGPLLLKQIEEIIMLPARDVREYSYMLIKEGFVRNRQVPKTPDNAPGKSIFIMSVGLDQVVYSAADLCCRTMNNLLVRHEFEKRRNKSLLERAGAARQLLEVDCAGRDITKEDWNQYFNSHELSQLDKVNRVLDRLLLARTQVDETLFLLHTWLIIRPGLEVGEED